MRLMATGILIVALAGCGTRRQAGIGIGVGLGIMVGSLAVASGMKHGSAPGGDFAVTLLGGGTGLGIAVLSLIDLGLIVARDHAPPDTATTPGTPANEIGAVGSSCADALEHCAYGLACQQGVCTRVPD